MGASQSVRTSRFFSRGKIRRENASYMRGSSQEIQQKESVNLLSTRERAKKCGKKTLTTKTAQNGKFCVFMNFYEFLDFFMNFYDFL